MTQDAQPPAAVDNQALIAEVLAAPREAPPAEETTPVTPTAGETTQAETTEKVEPPSRKAAQESKRLREERARAKALEDEVKQLRAMRTQVEELEKVKELSKTDRLALLKHLNIDPLEYYQGLTDNFLQGNIKQKDPVEEQLKAQVAKTIDPYIESLKKKERELQEVRDQQAIATMISTSIAPVINQNPDNFELLIKTCGSKEEAAKQVYHAANQYWITQLKGDPANIPSLEAVANHLEKQLRDQKKRDLEELATTKAFQEFFHKSSTNSEPSKASPSLANKTSGIQKQSVEQRTLPFAAYDNRDESRMSLIEEILKNNPRKKPTQ